MKFHNGMEDVVMTYLDNVLSDLDDVCHCDECKFDMACYVLNRVPASYTGSVMDNQIDLGTKYDGSQMYVDIFAKIIEAIKFVSLVKQHTPNNRWTVNSDKNANIAKSRYVVPKITGRVVDIKTLDPITDIEIALFHSLSKDLVAMRKGDYENPYHLTNLGHGGKFTFLPDVMCADTDEKKDFVNIDFHIKFSKESYEPFSKYISVKAFKEGIDNNNLSDSVYDIGEIYISPM